MKIFGNGQGGKHRGTQEAARWRWATTQIANRLREEGMADCTTAQLYAEDELARAARSRR